MNYVSQCATRASVTGPRWYVVQTRHLAERVVVAELKLQGFSTFLALRARDPRNRPPDAPRLHRRREDEPRLVPAFPGYVFVLFDRETQRWRAICSTRGVKRLFSSGPETPTAVPVGIVEDLRARMPRELVQALSGEVERLKPGAIVEVARGPLSGRAGLVLWHRDGAVRVRDLESGFEAEMPAAQVEVIGSGGH